MKEFIEAIFNLFHIQQKKIEELETQVNSYTNVWLLVKRCLRLNKVPRVNGMVTTHTGITT